MRKQLLPGLALLLAVPAIRGADHAPDPFLGRWVLVPAESKYADHRCPRKMVIEMVPDGTGIHYHSETEPALGEIFHVDYTANYDGKPAIVTGDRGILLPVTLRRDTNRHVTATYTSALQVMATSERIVSADGTVMRVVTVSHDSFGQSVTNIGVYHRDVVTKGSRR